jgi:WD40 repeat protein
VKLWDVAEERCLRTISVSSGHVAVSPSGERVATIGPDYTIELRDRESLEVVSRLTGHRSSIKALAFSADGNLLASGGDWEDTAIRIWNVASGDLVASLQGRDDPVMSVAFDSTGTLLASTKLNTAVELWDVGSKRLLDTKSGGHPCSVAFSPDNKLLAQVHGISDAGSGVYLWRVRNEEK